jgi:hypothetical protein
MIKTLSAALVAVSMLAAPALAATAEKMPAAPIAKPMSAGTTVKAHVTHVKKHVARHHRAHKHVAHAGKRHVAKHHVAKRHLSKAQIRHVATKRG